VTVAQRWLLDRRRGLAGWTLGVTGLVLFTVAFFPTVEGDETFENLTDQLPASLRSLLGLAQGAPITSAPGYLHARLFSTLLPLLFVVYAIGLGARAIAGTEEDGTLEILLAHPVTRTRVALERYLANTALLAALTVVFVAVLAASAPPLGALDGVSLTGLAGASAGAFALAILHGSIAYTVGAATGRRAPAIAAATTIAVAGYLIEGLLAVSDTIRPLRYASPWHWYLGRNMLTGGTAPDALAPPLLLSLALLAAATHLLNRRDLR
jgi:beta-exotoxin I transport system permease protein